MMKAEAAFEKRRDELAQRLSRADDAGEAMLAAVMTLEQVAADLAQQEDDGLSRQRQQAVLAVARSAPGMLRAARAKAQLVMEEKKPERRVTLIGIGALIAGVLALWQALDGHALAALLQVLGAGLIYFGALRQGGGVKAQAAVYADEKDMLRAVGEVCRAADICVSDLKLIEQDGARAHLTGTADEATIDLLASLLEAGASGRPEAALRSLDQVRTYMNLLGMEMLDYSEENAALFDVLPTLGEARTIRPAILQDGKVIRRGAAALKMERGVGV